MISFWDIGYRTCGNSSAGFQSAKDYGLYTGEQLTAVVHPRYVVVQEFSVEPGRHTDYG